jgi:hypothetical protein
VTKCQIRLPGIPGTRVRSLPTWPFLADVAKQVARSGEVANPQAGAVAAATTTTYGSAHFPLPPLGVSGPMP